jgi:hypothetical protein
VASVHQLIQQIRRNTMNSANPQALLDEIDNLIRQQDTMRQMVDTTQQQTLKFQANLGGIDERVEVLREQHQRMVDVTIAQLHSLLKKVVESVRLLLASQSLFFSPLTSFPSLLLIFPLLLSSLMKMTFCDY